MTEQALSAIDARILAALQQDGRTTNQTLADGIGMSASPCWRRIKRLEDSGLIRKRVTLLDAGLLGRDFEVYASVKLSLPSREKLDIFGIGTRPTAFDEGHAQIIQALRDADFVVAREGKAFTLSAIAQSRIVNLN